MDNAIKVTTRFSADQIQQFTEGFTDTDDRMRFVIQLREEGVKRALKALGWVPPDGVEAMKARYQADALEGAGRLCRDLDLRCSSFLEALAAELRSYTDDAEEEKPGPVSPADGGSP